VTVQGGLLALSIGDHMGNLVAHFLVCDRRQRGPS